MNEIEAEISQLNIRRERIKLALLEKQALRTQRFERFIKFGEETPLHERLSLDSDIAALEVDRQSSKVRLMEMKAEAREFRSQSLVSALFARLTEEGLVHILDEVRAKADEAMKQSGHEAAYKS